MRLPILTFFVFCLVATIPVNSLLAQQGGKTGNWLMYFGQNRFHDKWSVHTEVQYRNHTIKPDIEQLLLRTGVNYHLPGNATVLLGYGYVTSYDEDDIFSAPKTKEHRLFQEFQLNQKLGPVSFNHRYRIEQRWVDGNFRDRYRYRILAMIPLSGKADTYPFLSLYDEIFITRGDVVFDRNRVYGALGYKFSKTTSVQAGILNQQVNDFNKWYLQFALFYNPAF